MLGLVRFDLFQTLDIPSWREDCDTNKKLNATDLDDAWNVCKPIYGR